MTIERHDHVIAEIGKPCAKRALKFGTLKGIIHMTPQAFREATRSKTDEEVDFFVQGRY